MFRLTLPSPQKIDLADWLELFALIASDKSSSSGDLERALRRASLINPDNSLAIEAKCVEVFLELERRASAAQHGYPFTVKDGRLHRMSDWRDYPSYVFCLCLSYFGWKPIKGAPVDPWRLFEELSCVAARNYVQGECLPFGSHARLKVKNFSEAVETLVATLREGGGFKKAPSLKPNDDRVDLVAWREFADKRSSKFVMFGQCASGKNWRGKRSEMQPNKFWGNWMKETNISPLTRSFYFPHVVSELDDWEHLGRDGGILFDRCRIAYWARTTDIKKNPRYSKWCRTAFTSLRNA